MKIELDDEHVCEVFEILCELSFDNNDGRHPGIEQILSQLRRRYDLE